MARKEKSGDDGICLRLGVKVWAAFEPGTSRILQHHEGNCLERSKDMVLRDVQFCYKEGEYEIRPVRIMPIGDSEHG